MSLPDKHPATSSPAGVAWHQRLWMPVDISSVVFFRIVFACTMLWHVILMLQHNAIEYYFAGSRYHLKCCGFEWVHAADAQMMRGIHLLMGIAAIGVALGLLYRLSAILLFVTYTYTFLAEAAHYQNHYYLMSLIAFLLILIPSHRCFSLDSLLVRKEARCFIPAWNLWMLMFIVALPYTYGGIAKLNSDWLHAMPLRIWIPQKTHLAIIGPILAQPWTPWILSYAGLVLDLLFVPLLLWRKTRLITYIIIVVFHLMNSLLFTIDVFPWLMMLLTTIFFSPDWPRKLLRQPLVKRPDEEYGPPSAIEKSALITAGIFVVWQLLFPLRHYVYPGDASWTEEGQNFSWRMMLHHKDLFLRIYATDGITKQTAEIPISRMLSQRQLMVMARSPEQIAAAAHFFATAAARTGMKNIEIHAVAIVALNGRKPQLMFDPDLDLLTVERTWKHQPWVYPLTEPLREEPWSVRSAEWPGILGVRLPDAIVPLDRTGRSPSAR